MPIEQAPVSGRMYRHYKGGIYSCHGTATHTETNEVLVVYRHVSGELHARPLSVWNELVDLPTAGRKVQRFQLLPMNFKLAAID